jgi:hypothetical protein
MLASKVDLGIHRASQRLADELNLVFYNAPYLVRNRILFSHCFEFVILLCKRDVAIHKEFHYVIYNTGYPYPRVSSGGQICESGMTNESYAKHRVSYTSCPLVGGGTQALSPSQGSRY